VKERKEWPGRKLIRQTKFRPAVLESDYSSRDRQTPLEGKEGETALGMVLCDGSLWRRPSSILSRMEESPGDLQILGVVGEKGVVRGQVDRLNWENTFFQKRRKRVVAEMPKQSVCGGV